MTDVDGMDRTMIAPRATTPRDLAAGSDAASRSRNLTQWFAAREVRRRIVRWSIRPLLRSAARRLAGAGELAQVAIHRVLVVRPNHRLGNVILLTPLIAELERAFPGAEIDILAAGGAAEGLLRRFPLVHRVHALPHRMVRHPFATIATLARLRKNRYDLAIDAGAGSLSGRLLLALAAPRYGLGVPDACEPMQAETQPSLPRHFAKLPVFLLRRALAPRVKTGDTPYPPVTIRLTSLERDAGHELLGNLADPLLPGRTTLGVFANATGAKRYADSWWIEFLSAINAALPSCTIVEFLAADGRSRLGDRFRTYYSNDVRKLASVISNLTCFVSADCGVMHLAAASGVPTIGLFSVTDPTRYEPYGGLSRSVLTTGRDAQEIAAIVLSTLRTAAREATGEPCATVAASRTAAESHRAPVLS